MPLKGNSCLLSCHISIVHHSLTHCSAMKFIIFVAFNIGLLVSGLGILRLPESYYKLQQPRSVDPKADVGEPLFLTPLIQAGQIELAWDLSLVTLPGSDVESHSGYFTVNSLYNSNLFFWFFPAKINPAEAPVVLWLNGGPGASSLFGLFGENGPIYLDESLNLHPRNYSWANEFNMIYIDNPVGTGYSFTGDDDGFATTEEDVGEDLYNALQQFFAVFPYHRNNDFYITGESYAGKYIPALAYTIHVANQNATQRINLKGLAIGNGLIDPITMFDYGDFLYTIGLIDYVQRQYFLDQTELARTYIANEQWLEAFNVYDYTINGDIWPYPTYFKNVTGFVNYFNYLYSYDNPSTYGDYHEYVQQDEIRKAIHVGNLTFNNGLDVELHLMEDIMKSTKPWVETLLDNDYRVLIYSGQLDIIIGTVLTEHFLTTLSWKHSDEFKVAERLIWRNQPGLLEVSGYVKQLYNLAVITIRNSGHMVPTEQPSIAYDMITNFVFNRTFTD